MDPIAEQLIARLHKDPQDGAAYEGLKAHYQHAGDLASLANLLEGWANSNTHGRQEASQAYAEAAEAVLQSTADRARAKSLYRRSVELNVLHSEAGAKLIALLEEETDRQELVEFLDAYAKALEPAGTPNALVASLYQRLGELYTDEFAQPEQAENYYERARSFEQPEAPDFSTLSDDDARALADDYEQRALAERNPLMQVALLSQLAELRAQRLDDLDGAIAALRQALAAAPGDVAIMHQLATCLLARAEAQADQPEDAHTDHRRAAELLYQIAQGVDESEALPYLESALTSIPDHDGALALLERLAPAQGRSEILPAYWVRYVSAAGQGPEADQRRLLLAQAYLQTDQLEDAIFCLQAAAEHGNGKAHELLQEAYARQSRGGGKPREAGEEDQDRGSTPPDQVPAQRPPARRPDEEVSRGASQIAELRKHVQEALAARRHDEAADHCRAILALDPSDAEAFNVLESHYRKRRDYTSLRDLLLASTRMSGLAVDARKMRLREVATMSETKLRDPGGATSAWRGVVTLDPGDREALASLKRLLKKGQEWDELASVLEREALATTAIDEKAGLIREIAMLHRDKRKDKGETAEALRQLYALKPDDSVRDELCTLLIEIEQWEDAVPLLRERIRTSKDETEKLKLSATLALLLHERLEDLEGAHEVCEAILALRHNDRAAFERMERIDEQSGNYARLLTTLERRALLAAKNDRPALFTRMGVIAEEQLQDIDKAADYFGDALDLAPDRGDTLKRLVEMFERAGHHEQLVELLRERAVVEKEPKNRAPFFQRIASTLAERLNDEEGAADAYRKLLELEESEEALRFLRGVAIRQDDPNQLADVLRRLCARVDDKRERRDLSFDLAVVLHERLSRTAEASTALKRLVQEIDPQFEPAIELLASISEATADRAGLALALERQLALASDVATRLRLAKRLSDLYERELRDRPGAIAALRAWVRDDARNAEPHRRLRKLLEQSEQWPLLLATLDALAEWEDDFEARDEAMISAARVAFDRLGDAQGAWRRLVPLVEERNEQADKSLRDVAGRAGLQRELAALYVRLAQETEDPALQALHWGSAAALFEHELADPAQAFEASLRRLASDLSNRDFLAQVERLAARTKLVRRLTQVYDRLLKQADDDAEKVALLKRHAALLVEDQPDEALDRILRACALAPHDTALLTLAEELAQRADRSEELLVVYDRRRARGEDDLDKLRLLLRAAKLCDGALRDRERANQYLKGALVLASVTPEFGAEIEAVARDLDSARPELGPDAARRALIRAHREVAERAEPTAAMRLLLRAAELLRHELDDERGAFDLLRQALQLLPKSDEVYTALLALAEKQSRLDSLDAHLSRLTDDAIDSATAVALLRRRGMLLEGPLHRFQDAAAVYTKLLQLRPDDAEAAEKLHKSLRQSGRHQDLLLALNKQLQRTRDGSKRVSLLKEIARTWERDLKNRWEARDAWKAVLVEAPGDATASDAVQRLERGRGALSEAPAEHGDGDTAGDEHAAATHHEVEHLAESSTAEQDAAEEHDRESGVQSRSHDENNWAADASVSAEGIPDSAVDTAAAIDRVAARSARAFQEDDQPPPVGEVATATSTVAAAELERRTPEPMPAEPEHDDGGDLGALDAAMSAGRGRLEEVDLFEQADEFAVDVEVEHAPPARPSSLPPPPPPARPHGAPLPSLRSAAPPPTPRRSAAPPIPPLQPGRRTAPPPVPRPTSVPVRAASKVSAAPPSPPRMPPPPPSAPASREASQPPPAPGARVSSRPPPLPASRKQQ